MTAQQPAEREPGTPPGAVARHSLLGIRRAGGREPARGRRPRGHRTPVEPDQSEEESGEHRLSVQSISWERSSSKAASYASPRARTRTSLLAPASSRRGSISTRPISRSRRFNRFRSTILRPWIGTITPRREWETGEAASKTSRWDVLSRFPRLRVRRISPALVIRLHGGNRCPPGAPGRPGRALVTRCYLRPNLVPIRTERRLRPLRRRRFRAFRPPLLFMRARKPCLFFLLRLRGLYVGFMKEPRSGAVGGRSLRTKHAKISVRSRPSQPCPGLAGPWRGGPPRRAGEDAPGIDFSTCPG